MLPSCDKVVLNCVETVISTHDEVLLSNGDEATVVVDSEEEEVAVSSSETVVSSDDEVLHSDGLGDGATVVEASDEKAAASSSETVSVGRWVTFCDIVRLEIFL